MLLDHGYCIQLPPWLRQSYCQLWCSKAIGDRLAAEEVGRKLVGDHASDVIDVLFGGGQVKEQDT